LMACIFRVVLTWAPAIPDSCSIDLPIFLSAVAKCMSDSTVLSDINFAPTS
jgi:hypothetical protein